MQFWEKSCAKRQIKVRIITIYCKSCTW